MKKLLIIIIMAKCSALDALSQTQILELVKANDCFAKKEYGCAIDNYLISLDKKSYVEKDRYILEYRIAVGYSNLSQFDKSKEYYEKAMLSKPNHFNNYWGLADLYYNFKKYTDAVASYKKTLDLATDAKDKESINWWLGKSYDALKNYTEVIPAFKKVQSREGRYIKIDASIGDAFFSLKKYDSALVYYKKAEVYYAKGDSNLKYLKCYMGKCYREKGNYTDALAMQDEALAIDPRYDAAMWEKGIINANKKDYAAAIDWYKKAAPYYTTDTADMYTLCGNIAACYLSLGNYAEATNWQIKRRPYSKNKYIEYLKIATYQYGKLKQPKEAEKTCTEAINLYLLESTSKKSLPTDEYVKLNGIIGKIFLERKDTAKALKYFETALKLSKGSYDANAGAGQIAWARKQEAEYKTYYTNIFKFNYDTLLSTKKEIADVFGRSAYTDAYINKYNYYSSSVESALQFDSMQKEAVLLWPIVLTNAKGYKLTNNRVACLSVLNKAAKYYAADKSYVSEVYNSIAVMHDTKDTAAIHKAIQQAVKWNPENIKAWDNLMKYYTSYDSQTGVVAVEKLIAILKKQKDNASTASAYVYKGDFLWRLVKKEEAKKAWQEALVWDANNASAKERVKL